MSIYKIIREEIKQGNISTLFGALRLELDGEQLMKYGDEVQKALSRAEALVVQRVNEKNASKIEALRARQTLLIHELNEVENTISNLGGE